MLKATCHCGAVEITIPRRPETITNCDCSICRRYGTLWGYFASTEVTIRAEPGATQGYAWGATTIRFVRCERCGCVTHWEPIVASRGTRMGINIRNFDPDEIGDVRIRRLDGSHSEQYIDPP